jgi:hypothetical protein
MKSIAFFLARNNIIRSKILVTNQNKHKFGPLFNNDFIKDKKIISISPGGFKGFYMLGICKFIKQNYDLDDYIFSGASAGAWNSLVLSYKGNIDTMINNLLDDSLHTTKTIHELENLIKHKLLSNYKTDEFDLMRLFIGVTTMSAQGTNTIIYSGFESLEDAINCCIASSHIPLITGGLTNIYRNEYSFDGGFSRFPYLNITNPVIHITPSIWKPTNKNNNEKPSITDYTTLFSKDDFKFYELIEIGYQDAERHKNFLDNVFKKK